MVVRQFNNQRVARYFFKDKYEKFTFCYIFCFYSVFKIHPLE